MIAFQVSRYVFLGLGVSAVAGAEPVPQTLTPEPAPCADVCAAEFQRCYNHRLAQGTADSYTQCRSELDAGQGPLGQTCTPGCTNTGSMQALVGHTDPGSPAERLGTGSFSIEQPSLSRSVHVNVPEGDGPFPVIILLHGNGGTGSGTLNSWTRNPHWAALKASHVLAAPDGHHNSWNILSEQSDQDDVYFVERIIDYLASKSNVNANHVQLYGNSNGAALVNRILIESVDPRIVRGVTVVSQLNQRQYRGGSFYFGGQDNSYSQVQPSLLHREILAVQGAEDTVIPTCACESAIGFWMNSDTDSIYAYAVAYGYTGAQLTASDHSTYYSFSYMGGAVSSYTIKEAGHSAVGRDAAVDDAVLTFLQRILPVPTQTPSPTPELTTATHRPTHAPTPTPAPEPPAPTLRPTPAPESTCSDACTAEFQKCYNHHAALGTADSYTQCRSELDAGQGPLGQTCTPGCTNTGPMQALATVPTQPPTSTPEPQAPTSRPTPTSSPTPVPEPPVPTLRPTPAPQATCSSSCMRRPQSWAKKCAWRRCTGCSQCTSSVAQCKNSCTRSKQEWDKKCKWQRCKGCSECQGSRRMQADFEEPTFTSDGHVFV